MLEPKVLIMQLLALGAVHFVVGCIVAWLVYVGQALPLLVGAERAVPWPPTATCSAALLVFAPLLVYLVFGGRCREIGDLPGGWPAAVAVVLALAAAHPLWHNSRRMRMRPALLVSSWQLALFGMLFIAAAAGPVLFEAALARTT